MAPLTLASRLCLRSAAAAAKPIVPAVRAAALSTSTALRADGSDSATYTSPFSGGDKGNNIPDFGKYVSKNTAGKNKLFSYFMVGTMGAVAAAGAKSTVQGA